MQDYPAFVKLTAHHWQAGSVSLQIRFIVRMKNIDNDFAHTRNLWSDCHNSLHMLQSWAAMACAKKSAAKYIQDNNSEIQH